MLGGAYRRSGGSLLGCDQISEATGEYGDGTVTAETPELLMGETEWLDFLDVPEQSQVLTADETPAFGLVEVAPDADGVVTPAESRGEATSFLAYEDGEPVAQLYVERAPNGEFWVAGTTSC